MKHYNVKILSKEFKLMDMDNEKALIKNGKNKVTILKNQKVALVDARQIDSVNSMYEGTITNLDEKEGNLRITLDDCYSFNIKDIGTLILFS